MTDKLATIPEGAIQVGELMARAIDKGMDVEGLKQLFDLHERLANRMAAQEFAGAMAKFQAECPPIQKTSVAKVTSKRTGASFKYHYAELDAIARVVNPLLSELGLSYTWDSEATDHGIKCCCTLRHVNGHSVTATFAAPIDQEAAMNVQQRGAAALTYARRQALVQVLGLTMTDADTDGKPGNGNGGGHGEVITSKQAADLEALIDEVKADRSKFLAYLGVDEIEMIPLGRYVEAVEALEDKRKRSK